MKPLADWTEQELLDYGRAGILPGQQLRPLEEWRIKWEPEPPFRLEDLDMLSLTGDEVFPFGLMLQQELRRVREVLHVAVAELAVAHRQLRQRKTTMAGDLLPEAPALSTRTASKEAGTDGPNDIRERANY